MTFCTILPEYIHKQIVDNGTDDQKRRAFQNLIMTEQLRGVRSIAGGLYVMFATSQKLNRSIFTAKSRQRLPGYLVRREGEPSNGHTEVDEAYNYSGDTYNFFNQIFERDSIDNSGMRLDSTVHFSYNYNNAFWNGTQMVFGDGDGELFNRFTICIDVTAHELTHGITQYEADLEYHDQSGALNESFSDVMGSLVKQYRLQETVDEADWLIGAGLFTPIIKGQGLRSMKEPGTAYDDPVIGKDPQPAHMDHYIITQSDNGGVHINSGIPNRAFYLTAMELGGYAWERAGKIWYTTLRDRLRELSSFQDAANLTYSEAGNMYGLGSAEQIATAKGWKGVGIEVV